MRKRVTVNIGLEDWNKFKKKYYLNMSRRLGELVLLDLQNKLDNDSQSPKPSLKIDIREGKTD